MKGRPLLQPFKEALVFCRVLCGGTDYVGNEWPGDAAARGLCAQIHSCNDTFFNYILKLITFFRCCMLVYGVRCNLVTFCFD